MVLATKPGGAWATCLCRDQEERSKSLARHGHARRILIHINNSNPILIEGSPEEAKVKAAGWEIAFDGMEIGL